MIFKYFRKINASKDFKIACRNKNFSKIKQNFHKKNSFSGNYKIESFSRICILRDFTNTFGIKGRKKSC